jgi:hypothetical protein
MVIYIQHARASHPMKLASHGSIKQEPKQRRRHGNFLTITQTGVSKMSKQKALENLIKNNPAYAERIYSIAYEMIYEPDLLIMAELARKHAETRGTEFYKQIISYIKRFLK